MSEPKSTLIQRGAEPAEEKAEAHSIPDQKNQSQASPEPAVVGEINQSADSVRVAPREVGGPAGLEPTRYGDWEHKGRCIDF